MAMADARNDALGGLDDRVIAAESLKAKLM